MSDFVVKDDGTRVLSETGAARQNKAMKGRFDLIPTEALRRLALHYEGGAKAYGDRNWEKGLPLSSFYNSGQRHLLAWASGDGTEDHLAAVMWNAAGAMWTVEQIRLGNLPESLNDIPSVKIPIMARAIEAIDRMREKLPEQVVIDAGVKPNSEYSTVNAAALHNEEPPASAYDSVVREEVEVIIGLPWMEAPPFTEMADLFLRDGNAFERALASKRAAPELTPMVAKPARSATHADLERLYK